MAQNSFCWKPCSFPLLGNFTLLFPWRQVGSLHFTFPLAPSWRIGPLPWACHLVLVVELVCLSDPKSYVGDLIPGGFNRAGLVEG